MFAGNHTFKDTVYIQYDISAKSENYTNYNTCYN